MSKNSSNEDGTNLGTTMNSIRILAVLISILSAIAILLEKFFTEEPLIYIYIVNGVSILFSIAVIVFSMFTDATKLITKITHALVAVLILSLLLAVYFYPLRFQMNIILLGVFLFLISLGISWKLINQVLAAGYSILLAAVLVYVHPEIDIYSVDIIQGSSIFVIFSLVSIITAVLVNRFRINIKSEIKKNIVATEIADTETGQIIRNQNMYKTYVEKSKIGLFSIDAKGNFEFVSDSMHIIFGYDSEEEFAKINFFSLFLEEADSKEMVQNVVRKKGRVKNYKAKLKKKNASRFIANLNVELIQASDSESKFYEGSVEDVTQEFIKENNLRKEITELRKEKDQNVQMVLQAKHSGSVKAQFLANMSHELKTPINSVLGFLNLIEKGMFSSVNELREFAANTKIAVDSLFDIVSNVLDISKIEAGKLELDHVQFNFHTEVGKAKSIITPKAMEKELQLKFNVSDQIPKSMYGDPTRMRQILVNLLTNSVKNTDTGEISVTADVLDKTMETVKIKVSVTDTGRGIPEDKLKILFKPYTQIKNKKGAEKEGTGLGLMITKQFITLMGGKIEIHSDEGIGTRVEFTVAIDLTVTKMPKLATQQDELDEPINKPDEETADETVEEPAADSVPLNVETPAAEPAAQNIEEPVEDSIPEPVEEQKSSTVDTIDLKERERLAWEPVLPNRKKPKVTEKPDIFEPPKNEVPESEVPESEVPEKEIPQNEEIQKQIEMLQNEELLQKEDVPKKVEPPQEVEPPKAVEPPQKIEPPKKAEPPKKEEIPEPEEVVKLEDHLELDPGDEVGLDIKINGVAAVADGDEMDTAAQKPPAAQKAKPPKVEKPPVVEPPPVLEEPSPIDESSIIDGLPEMDDLPDVNMGGFAPIQKQNGKKILLVEDNPISQKVERKILLEFGYDVVTVSSGKEAVTAVQKEYYNVILMDIQMSDMDGIAATKKIRSMDDPINKIPIIAVTAHSSMKDREMCLASGMDDYIAKPINVNFLRMTIDQWIDRDHYD